MTPLPASLETREVVAWRIDEDRHREVWDSGIGAARRGGRWNSTGTRAVYFSLDPATAILEIAVHVGFDDLDRIPRVLTSLTLMAHGDIHVVGPADVPNPNWLRPGRPSTTQQHFGDRLLRDHGIFVIPSAVSSCSWNLVLLAGAARAAYRLRTQAPFALSCLVS